MLKSLVGLVLFSAVVEAARYKKWGYRTHCDALENMTISGKDVGRVAKLVCKAWKSNNFPVKSALKFEEYWNIGMDGGIWAVLDKAKEDNQGKFCWRSTNLKVNGTCRLGYKSAAILGKFTPVCSSACTETTYPVGCGLGCSKSRLSCALTIADQIRSVAEMLGNVQELASHAVGALVEKLLDEIRGITDFALNTFNRVKGTALQAMAGQSRDGVLATVLTMVFTFTAEKDQVLEDYATLKYMVGNATEMFSELFEGDFTPLGIASTIAKFGKKILKEAVRVSNVFTTNVCRPVDKTVAFTVDSAGDDRIIGQYIQNGTHDGQPQYVMRGKPMFGLMYKKSTNIWRFYAKSLTGVFSQDLYATESHPYPAVFWRQYKAKTPKNVEPSMPEIVPVTEEL